MAIFLLFALIGVTFTHAELCADVDTTLCRLLTHRLTETCTDPCLYKFCKKSCGMCALQCYDCVDLNDPSTCNSTKTCSSADEYCFSAQTFTSSLKLAYRMGCATEDTCAQFSAVVGRKRVNFEAGCCNQDYCNNNSPTSLQVTPLTTPSAPLPTTSYDLCLDRDQEICTMFAMLFDTPCSQSCVSELCPHMCKQCFSCLACNEVKSTKDCHDHIICGNGTVCYGYEKLDSKNDFAIELGCMDKAKCSHLESGNQHHPILYPVGKRDFSLLGGCCIGDDCNLYPLGVPTTTSVPVTTLPTTSPTPVPTTKHSTPPVVNCPSYSDCPVGFLPHGSYCYTIGAHKLRRFDAENFCQQRCAHLVKFVSKTEILEVFSYFDHTDHEVYTSLSRHSQGYWYWASDDTVASSQMLENDFNLTKDSCAVAYISFHAGVHSYPVYTYGMNPISCLTEALPMCYIPRAS